MSVVKDGKKLVLPVTIKVGFSTLEQKLVFEAIVLPEIEDLLIQYAPLLDCDKSNNKNEMED